MSQTIQAIYQNGMFRPIKPYSLDFIEGKEVELTVNERKLTPEQILALAAQVYEGLSEADIDEIEKIALDRSNFFGDRDR